MMYCGISSPCAGRSIVPMRMANQSFFPVKGILAKAKATSDEERTPPTVHQNEIVNELVK